MTVGNIASGILGPLEGFMGKGDYRGVLDAMRPSDDTPWTPPKLLHIPEVTRLSSKDEVGLVSQRGTPVATLQVDEMFHISRKEYTGKVYGTEDPSHPGVAKLLSSPERVASGSLKDVAVRRTQFDDDTLSPKGAESPLQRERLARNDRLPDQERPPHRARVRPKIVAPPS